MTDLHTHILPQMDDGSKSVEESLQMLEQEWQQGVRTVYLTPHFYREDEDCQRFLQRRARSFAALQEALPEKAPALRLGAEVAWFPTLPQYEELEALCLEGTHYFLLELPFTPWSGRLLQQLDQLPDRTGLTPILAHVERYVAVQGKSRVKELMQLDLPMQINAGSILEDTRHSLGLLKKGTWALSSDSHNMSKRPVNIGPAAKLLQGKLKAKAEDMLHWLSAWDEE